MLAPTEVSVNDLVQQLAATTSFHTYSKMFGICKKHASTLAFPLTIRFYHHSSTDFLRGGICIKCLLIVGQCRKIWIRMF